LHDPKPIGHPGPLRLIVVLSVGLCCVSTGGVLVRLAGDASSLVIAFYRLLWASIILLPFYLLQAKGRHQWTLLHLWAGLSLALHFGFWIASVKLTSIAVSVLLVNTSPVLVATVSHFYLGERLRPRGAIGIGLSFAGGVVLVWQDLQRIGDWRGAFLAVLGAVAFAAYLLIGRRLRSQLSLFSYVYPTYLVAMVSLALTVLATGLPLRGFSGTTWSALLLLGLVPQCIGHTSYNWALRYLPATVVSTLILMEPVLATVAAWLFLGEGITLEVLAGGVLLGAGIILVTKGGMK